MKLIIDIPEDRYDEIHSLKFVMYGLQSEENRKLFYRLINAVQDGTPIPDNATVCDIEQIRAEITEELEDSIGWGGDQLYNAALKKALEIFDKYTNGNDMGYNPYQE